MLTRVLNTVRLDTIDHRSKVGSALRRIRTDLVAQLGGEDQITPALAILIDQVAIKAVITTSVGNWLLSQETLVDPEHHELVGVVLQHDTLQRTLAVLLDKLGLRRVPAPVEDLRSSIARREATKERVPEPASPAGPRHAQEP
jgi:hypothetical protein